MLFFFRSRRFQLSQKQTSKQPQHKRRLQLERLEDRTLPATNITILAGAAGSGTLDHFLSATQGTITVADDPGDTAATLSTGALAGVGLGVQISISADSTIHFNDLGTLSLQTGLGVDAAFNTTTGAILFANTANNLVTAGGNIDLSAGTDLTVSNLNTNGGDVFLTAGTAAAGNLQFANILTSGSGNITLQATNAAGGTITQSGTSAGSGLAIDATATGDISVNSLRGTTVSLTSNTGSVTSAGSKAVQASAGLTIHAATGITLNTLAASLQATNSTSGDISITQAASPAQTLTINGTGVINNASGGSVSISNLGSGITINSGTPVASNNGDITLAGTDLQINGTVNSGTARTTLTTSQAGEGIDLGTNTPGKIGLTQLELANVTAGVLQIGTPSAGSINVSAIIFNTASWNVLTLVNGSTITEAAAGFLALPNLRVSSTGPVTLTSANNVGVVAADMTGSFAFSNGTNLLTVGVVDGDTGIVTSSSDMHLIADDMDIAQQITTGSTSAGVVNLEPFTSGRTIDLGTNTSGTLGLDNTELNEVTAGVLRIGSSSFAGSFILSADITPANIGALSLVTTGSGDIGLVGPFTITVAGGNGGLAVQAATSVALSGDVGRLAAAITGAGNNFHFYNTASFAVSTVDGVVGISTATGTTETVVLIAGGSVGQNPGANITSTNLLLEGTGGYTLDSSGNDISTLAANVTDSVSYTDANDLTVGTVIDPLIATPTIGITTSGADINIAASAVTNGTTLTVSNAIDTTSDANITLSADRMALLASANAHAGVVALEPTTPDRAVDLGTNADTTHLGLLQTSLNNVTAGVLRIGNLSSSGSIKVTAPITDGGTGWNTLSLLTEIGAGISQNGGAKLTVTNLNAGGNTGVTLNENNVVSTLAGATESGLFIFVDSTNLTIDNVDSGLGFGFGVGIITDGQAVSLTVNVLNDSLTINQQIDTTHNFGSPAPGGANIDLTADNMALNNNSPSSTINAGTGGTLTLTPFTSGHTIAVGGPDAAGQLGIDDNDLANVTAAVVSIETTGSNGGIITIDGTINTHPGYQTLDLNGGGSSFSAITQTTGSIAVANLALEAGDGIGSAGALEVVGPINVAFVNGHGNVQISSTGALTIAAVDVLNTSRNFGVGTVTLTASSPMTFAVNTTSGGTITATTTETASETVTPLPPPDDDITVNSGVTVESTGGDIDFTSGDSIVLQPGSTLTSDTGAVNLTAGMGDNDNDAVLNLAGTINTAQNFTITSSGDICIGTINAPGKTVTITSTGGAILDCDTGETEPSNPTDDFTNGASVDITADTLQLTASTGIGIVSGMGVGPLETQVGTLGADSTDGGIFITNGVTSPIALNIAGKDGVRVNGAFSVDIQLINQGTINIVTPGDQVLGIANVTLEAVGPTADINTGGQSGAGTLGDAIFTPTGLLSVIAGRDLNLGDNTGFGSVENFFGAIQLSAGRNITINANAHVTTGEPALGVAGSDISITAGTGGTFTANSAGDSVDSNGGNITISADHMVLNSGINASGPSGAGIVTLEQATTTTVGIDLGASVNPANLELSDAELGEVTASVLRIGRLDNTGEINIAGLINTHAGFNTLSFLTAGRIIETGGDITVTNLAIQASDLVDFNNPNDVSTLAANQTGGTVFRYLTSVNFSIGSVDGLDGLHTGADTALSAPGSDSLTVSNTAAAHDIDTNGHSLSIFAGTFTNDAGASIASEGAAITINADNMTLGASSAINAGTGRVDLEPTTSGRAIHLGDTGSASILGLTSDEINTITAGTLQIGANIAGDITFTAAIAPTGTSTLDLETGGGVSDGNTSEPDLTVANLALRTGNGVNLDTAVTDLAFNNTGGAVAIRNIGALTIAAVDGLTSSSNTATTTDLMASGNITFAADVQSAGALSANAQGDLSVNAGVTLESTGGNVDTDAGRNFTLPLGATLKSDTSTVSIGYGHNLGAATADLFGALLGTSASIDGGNGGDTFNINPSATPALAASGGTGSDIFNVTPNALSIITVHGNNPTPPADPGDSLNVALAGTTSPHLSATRTSTGYQGSWTFGNRANVNFDQIETLVQEKIVVAGADDNARPVVVVRDASGTQLASFLAFEPSFFGGVRVAVGDVNGDGILDIIVARGPGFASPPEVKVVDGTKLNMVDANGVIEGAALLADFDAYSPFFNGGVYVAFGMTASLPEIVTGAGAGGGPHVKVIDGTKLNQLLPDGQIADSAVLAQFYAYSPLFNGGVDVAAADLNGDGVADIVTGAGPGGGPHVKVIDGTKLHDLQSDSQPANSALLGQFYAYDPTFDGGVFVAVSMVGIHPIIVTGAGVKVHIDTPPDSIGPLVKVIDATHLDMLDNNSNPTGAALLAKFFAFDPGSLVGVRVAAADINGDGVADIITGGQGNMPPGNNPQPEVKVIDGTKLDQLQPHEEIADTALLDSFFLSGVGGLGVFVGGQ